MNILRVIIGAILGAVAATIFSWGGLYLYGMFVLHGNGSLFDTNPTAANLFFSIWLIFTALAAIASGYAIGKKRRLEK
ncbi:hypothetical protein M4D49_01235 [Cupriavidus pauculus]|uniref:hypothetical protein n=1 Tax=Cupriavidus pauculus TaxID=82633 RepID=UPI00203F9475|nr:hypothetical protein [Cupriavidus pauculus]MCM3604092.1 hypothetical protein [Cupriavidus pauculus]